MPHGGKRAGAGRPKGRLADETSDIKTLVVGALHAAGGVQYLARQAEQNPVAFLNLIGKVIPLQLAGHDGGKLVVDFRWADAPTTPLIDSVADETNIVTVETTNGHDDSDNTAVSFIGDC